MINFILNLIGKDKIWDYLLKQEGFKEGDEVSDDIWVEVFRKVPEIRQWTKNRDVALLRRQILGENTSDFIKGQIAENRMRLRFDIPSNRPLVKVEAKEPNVPSKDNFLKVWLERNGKKEEGGENKVKEAGRILVKQGIAPNKQAKK